jgi:transposase-like protein
MHRAKRPENWADRVKEAKKSPGGIAKYCRENGIVKSNFYYWKKKLAETSASPEGASPFARVQIIPKIEDPANLPNAKWLAEFLRAYAEASS